MQYLYKLQLGCMPDLRFDDCILSRLQYQWEMTLHKCLQSHSKYSGHDSCFICYDANRLISKLGFQGSKMWRANNFGRWSRLTQLMLGIIPPSLQCFNRNGLILSILCRGMSKCPFKKNWEQNHPILLYISTKLLIVFCFSWNNFLKTF